VRRFAGPTLLIALALVAGPSATARAGTYHVYACAAGGGHFSNASWFGAQVPGFVVDTGCTGAGTLVGLRIDGGKPVANGASAGLTFTSPPGTTIADFTFDRELDFNSNPPLADTRPLYAVYELGATVFAGAGDYHTPTRDRLRAAGAWYGYPANDAHLTRRVTRLRDMRALAGYRGDATTLSIRVGCYRRKKDCSAPAGGRVWHVLQGADVTINDPQPPVPTVTAEGLLAGGLRHGSDPVVLSATDNAGIRRVELIDVTTGAPALVGARNSRCNRRLARPCPDLPRTAVKPTALQVGQRSIVVRTIDAAGNGTDRGPFPVTVVTPSDRGSLNGSNATETATLTARFPKGDRRSRTVRYYKLVSVTGRLLNSSGQPIGDARLELVRTNLKPGARPVPGKTVTTKADGTFRFETRGRSSRTLTIGWKSHVNDTFHAASDALTLRTRASATLRASTRSPQLGQRLRLRGHLRDRERGVTVILQGRRAGARRFTTFADTSTRRRGRFAVSYRFRDPSSRGKRFTFRAKLKPGKRYPFETGYSRRVHVRVR
jgi:hypothetical protein